MLVSVYTGHENVPSTGRQEYFSHPLPGSRVCCSSGFSPQSVHTADSTLTEQILKRSQGSQPYYQKRMSWMAGRIHAHISKCPDWHYESIRASLWQAWLDSTRYNSGELRKWCSWTTDLGTTAWTLCLFQGTATLSDTAKKLVTFSGDLWHNVSWRRARCSKPQKFPSCVS